MVTQIEDAVFVEDWLRLEAELGTCSKYCQRLGSSCDWKSRQIGHRSPGRLVKTWRCRYCYDASAKSVLVDSVPNLSRKAKKRRSLRVSSVLASCQQSTLGRAK
jgi:hypothetical protein